MHNTISYEPTPEIDSGLSDRRIGDFRRDPGFLVHAAQTGDRLGLEQHQIAQGGLAGGGMSRYGEVADLFDRAILHSGVSRWRLRLNQVLFGHTRGADTRRPAATSRLVTGQRAPGWLPI